MAAVWDDDAIVHLGRCARRHPRLAGAVLDALRDIGSPRAEDVARQVETHAGSSTPGGGVTDVALGHPMDDGPGGGKPIAFRLFTGTLRGA